MKGSLNGFIKKAKEIHKDNNGNPIYDYSKTVYKNSREPLIIICSEHGEFLKRPVKHLSEKQGCPICAQEEKNKNSRMSQEEFILRCKEIHGNKYDYSKTEYITTNHYITIICPIHGEFKQLAFNHLSGQNCIKCHHKKITRTSEEFLQKCKEVHGDKYDYSKTEFLTSNDFIKIICPEHGEFQQLTSAHLAGKGCAKCGRLRSEKSRTKQISEFINRAKEIHGDRYDYSKSEYNLARDYITIICPEHGEFQQLVCNHLNGNGCPKCSSSVSKPELELQSLLDGFEIQTNCRDIIHNELDIYVPSKKLAIEYDGLYWHNEVNKPDKNYHLKKTEACEKQGIQLIHIFEDEWIDKQDIVKSRISNLLGINKFRIYARNCFIREVDTATTRKFLETNHIQGFVGSKVSYGLYFKIPGSDSNRDSKPVLVSLMTFGSLRKNLGSTGSDSEFELLRFCNKLNCSVVGGASKLFKHFITIHKPTKIISYADRRWSIGNLYEQLKFKFSHNSVPNYFYVMGQTRKNRFNFRKDVLISKYNCSPDDTEHNFCFNQGWFRIYDCGAKVYVWKSK